jgi:hypothetical protein
MVVFGNVILKYFCYKISYNPNFYRLMDLGLMLGFERLFMTLGTLGVT